MKQPKRAGSDSSSEQPRADAAEACEATTMMRQGVERGDTDTVNSEVKARTAAIGITGETVGGAVVEAGTAR